MDVLTFILFGAGLTLLVFGADALVDGASKLAIHFGVSPLVVGLTVVAFGTSAPEMAVSVQAALATQDGADIAIGNVVGSNIFNILAILGLSAVVAPLTVDQQLVRRDVPIMIALSVLVSLMALDEKIGRLEGALLFAGILCYTGYAVVQSRKESAAVRSEYEAEFSGKNGGLMLNLALIAGGVAMLILGSRWLLQSAVTVAHYFGISDLIVGLTIVSIGTSLPELATSVRASLKGERDIAVGNVVGSNIFNILAVLGLAATVAPDGVEVAQAAIRFDIPVMLAVSVACLPVFFSGYVVSRWEGLLFLGYYLAYTLWLIESASSPSAQLYPNAVMLYVVLALTAVALFLPAVTQLLTARKNVPPADS
ncbi:MAG: calcium/sodium antiporter [Gammaproteobacteria bacterium]